MSGAPLSWSDHSVFSRKRLGPAIAGNEHERHCKAMRLGSERLLKAIEEARK